MSQLALRFEDHLVLFLEVLDELFVLLLESIHLFILVFECSNLLEQGSIADIIPLLVGSVCLNRLTVSPSFLLRIELLLEHFFIFGPLAFS